MEKGRGIIQNSTRTYDKNILFAEFAKMRVAQKLRKLKIEEKDILASKEVEVLLEDTKLLGRNRPSFGCLVAKGMNFPNPPQKWQKFGYFLMAIGDNLVSTRCVPKTKPNCLIIFPFFYV